MSSEKVAVIGGTGFLGSNLVMALLEAGHTPVVVARRPDRIARVLPGIDVEGRRGDLTDLPSLLSALEGCDVIHSVAALWKQIYYSPNPDLLEAAIRTNVGGTLTALRAAHEVGARRVVVTSSAGTRYQAGGALANEDSPPTDPNIIDDAYIRSKVLEEAAVAAFAREAGLDVVSILPGGMIGPRDAGPTPLGHAVVQYLNGRAFLMIKGTMPIVDVRDVARAHVAAMERGTPGRSYLVVSMTLPVREFYNILTRLTRLPGPRVFLPPSMTMPMAYLVEVFAQVTHIDTPFTRNSARHAFLGQKYDCSRVQQELGIKFTPIESSICDTVVWYVENGWVSHPERFAPLANRAHGAKGISACTTSDRR